MIRCLLAAALTALLLCSCASEGSGFDVTETVTPEQIRAMLESAEESLRMAAEPEPATAETASHPEPIVLTEMADSPKTTDPVTTAEPNPVYWSPSGSVWHIDADCPSLKQAKAILSGSITDAMAAGKARVCRSCGE